MKLIRCHIENFGNLSNVTVEFNEGLNTIIHENGWGKSTLGAFIRIMLYGFNNERTRDELSNERRKFQPWQGGTYGGNLTFEYKEHIYTIYRVFSTKEKEDVFEVRDAKTNIVIPEFSSNIGEQLFAIDAPSFIRTIFVSQDDCYTTTTDSINAKIGNLAENTDDINNFETAMGYFKDVLNEYSPSRKSGKLSKLKDEITEAENILRKEQEYKDAAIKLKAQKDANTKQQEDIVKERDELAKLITLRSKADVIDSKIKHLELASEEVELLNSPEPTEALLGDLETKLNDLSAMSEQYSLAKLTDIETDKFYSLKDVFGEDIPTDEDIDDIISKKDFATKKHNINGMLPAVISCLVVLTIALCILGFFIKKPYLYALGGLTLASGIGVLVILVKRRKAHKQSVNRARKDVMEFLNRFGYNSIEQEEAFYDIRSKKNEYIELVNKKEAFEALKLTERIVTLREELDQTFEKYLGNIAGNDYSVLVGRIHNKIKDFANAKKKLAEYNMAVSEKKSLNLPANLPSVDEIRDRDYELSHRADHLIEELSLINNSINANNEKLDEFSIQKDILMGLKDRQQELTTKYKLIEAARDLMAEAKSNFTSRYLAPVMNAFRKYYSIFANDSTEYEFDANINLSVNKNGMLRNPRLLSKGYQDIVGVCMRLALADAMFEEEKPFVIFDDPFVNLDNNREKRAEAFINEIAKDRQVIFLSCKEKILDTI